MLGGGGDGKTEYESWENVRFRERPVPASARACLPSLGTPGMQGMELGPCGASPPETPKPRWGPPGYPLPFFGTWAWALEKFEQSHDDSPRQPSRLYFFLLMLKSVGGMTVS